MLSPLAQKNNRQIEDIKQNAVVIDYPQANDIQIDLQAGDYKTRKL